VQGSVLVVDAEGRSAVPRHLREGLDDLGWLFETNGTAALGRLRLTQPDLAIVNMQLPDMTGLRLMDRIRKGRPYLPIVMTSNLGNRLSEQLARTAGVVGYFPKPLDGELLGSLVEATFRRAGRIVRRAI
jgi:CheY-like chemotaxis protein